jgi:hypothetical protein
MSVRFEVEGFEQVQATPGTALLRLSGRWQAEVRERLAPPMLVIDDGRRTHRVAALPGPDEANPLAGPDAPLWRAAFAAPAALLGSRCAFALDVGRGGLIDIPRPGARAAAATRAVPAVPAMPTMPGATVPAMPSPTSAPPPAVPAVPAMPAIPAPAAPVDEHQAARERATAQEAADRARVQHEHERLAAAEHSRERGEREKQRLAAEERERERLRTEREQHLAAQRDREQALHAERERLAAERTQREHIAAAALEREQRETEARRAAEHEHSQTQREAQLRRAQEQREAELRRAHAQLEADAARAQVSRDAAARRISELEQRIDGYRDMLAQATEALAVANGRLETDAQELADALDAAAAQSAQREQAQADAQQARVLVAELQTEHERMIEHTSTMESDLQIERGRVGELQSVVAASEQELAQLRADVRRGVPPAADPGELAELQARVDHERAIAERLRAAYSQESAARDAEVLAWHAECQQALTRAAQLADALALARAELERLNDPSGLGVGSPAAPARGLIRFAGDE